MIEKYFKEAYMLISEFLKNKELEKIERSAIEDKENLTTWKYL